MPGTVLESVSSETLFAPVTPQESFDYVQQTISPSISTEEVAVQQEEYGWEVDDQEEASEADKSTGGDKNGETEVTTTNNGKVVLPRSKLRVQSKFLLRAGGIIVSSISRAHRKPRCESWPMSAEVIISFIKEAGRDTQATVEQIRSRIPLKFSIPIRGTKIEKVKINGIKCEWVIHSCAKNSNRFVYFVHGGAYCLHSPAFYRQMASLISRASCAKVLCVDYRLAPENPYPAGLDDVTLVYRWLVSSRGCKVNPKHMTVMGDSAGAGMTVALMLRLKEQRFPMPAGIVLFSPWVNLLSNEPSWTENDKYDYLIGGEIGALKMAKYYAGSESLKNPFISPMYADLKGLPPMLIHAGQLEMPRDQAVAFAKKAKDAGVDAELKIFPDMVHVFQTFAPLFPQQTEDSMQHINEFTNRLMPFEPSHPAAK